MRYAALPALAAAMEAFGGLKLDPADDPIFAELEQLDCTPGTPPLTCARTLPLVAGRARPRWGLG